MQASLLRLLYKQCYDNVAVLSPMSFTKLYQTDQFVAGFFTDLLHFLWNMKFVRWKDFLCLHEKLLSITVCP